MTKIDYLAIIKNAWNISWKNKFLWWFGFFILLGGGCNFNFSFPDFHSQRLETPPVSFINFLMNEKPLLAAGLVFLILLIAFFIFISIRGKAAMIKSIGKIMKKENCDFLTGFRSGKKYFWKIFLLGFIFTAVIVGLAIVLFVPAASLFLSKAYSLAIISVILAVAIIFFIAILGAFIILYALIYIVLAGLPIWEAVENGYKIFRKNIVASLIMGLFFIAFRLALFASVVFLGIALLIIFGPGTVVAYLIFSKIGVIIAGVVDALVFLFFLAILNSIYNTFSQAVWILFFNEIAKQKKEEIVEEAATYPAEISNPEKAI
jgi:hypothetical protein